MLKKYFYILFALSILIFTELKAQSPVRINEVQSVNGNTISDEDGDFEDWIEIVNTSSTTDINLQGYGLTDNDVPYKWKFPYHILKKQVSGQPFDRVLVFASAKDRYTQINHWEMTVKPWDLWKFLVNTTSSTAAPNWFSYMNNAWPTGKGSFGYGDGDDTTVIALNTISVFLQKQFTIDTSRIDAMVFAIDFDDAYVAYINGIEIARSNIIGTPPLWNTTATNDNEATMYHNILPEIRYFTKAQLAPFLNNGNNILSVQVHNVSASNSDLSAAPFLFFAFKDDVTTPNSTPSSWFPYKPKYFHTNFKIDNQGETIRLINPNTSFQADFAQLDTLQYNTSFARINPDGTGAFKIVSPPTPNKTNNGSISYAGYNHTPVINIASGFYQTPQTVSISGLSDTLSEIRYTLNGNVPKATDKKYSSPILIDSTRVLKARIFSKDNSKFPGGIATANYFINSPIVLPVLSINIDSLDLYDSINGIYIVGPNGNSLYPQKGANFWQNWERPARIEFYDSDANHTLRFATDGLIGIFGNYTRAKPQKSFDFKVKALYDSAHVDYQIFPERDKYKFKNFVIRNAGSDWMDGHIRDEYIHRLTYNNGIYSTASRTVVGYLNGKYWGVYHIREKSDEKYLSDLSGIDKDSIDQIRCAGRDYAANGTMDAFNEMINFFTNTNLAVEANYNAAKTRWNVDNFMTYYAVEMYAANDDWISYSAPDFWINNIKLWRPRGIVDAKWNYQMHDIDQGMLKGNLNKNMFTLVQNPGGANNHTLMFNKFRANPTFQRQFINKFFDLFNTSLHKDTMLKTLNNFVSSFEAEIPRSCKQFPLDPGMPSGGVNTFKTNDTAKFYSNIRDIKDFIIQRQSIVISQMAPFFNISLTDTARISIGVAQSDLSKGKVKLNSLPPTNQKWSGFYLRGNQVEAVAIAEPGYIFDYWGPSKSFDTTRTMTLIQYIMPGDSLIAHFKLAPNIAVSEFNYKSDPTRNSGEWIELFNYGPSPINISGWKIKKVSNGQVYTIPNSTIVNDNSYMVFVNDTNIFRSQFPNVPNKRGHTYMVFNDDGDEIQITDNQDNVITRFIYSDTTTWPDCAKGLGRTMQKIVPTANPNLGANWTCGCMGGSPGKAYTLPCPESIIFTELNYNSASLPQLATGDWVELYNRSDTVANLSGWIFKDENDDHSFVFPQGTKINPYNYLVLVRDTGVFEDVLGLRPYYNQIKKIGNFVWKLNGDKEAIRLYNSAGKIYQSMYYKDKFPWPEGANGLGFTLQLSDYNLNPCSPYSWFTGNCVLGSPGFAYAPACNLSVTEMEKGVDIKIYPNPANDYITVESAYLIENDSYFQVFDLQGRLVISQKLEKIHSQQIALNAIQKGMYIYRIISLNTTVGAGKIFKE